MASPSSYAGSAAGDDRAEKKKLRHIEVAEEQSQKMKEFLDKLRKQLVSDGIVDKDNEETLDRALKREMEPIQDLLVKLDRDRGDHREDAADTGEELKDLRDQLHSKSGKDWDVLIQPLLDDSNGTIDRQEKELYQVKTELENTKEQLVETKHKLDSAEQATNDVQQERDKMVGERDKLQTEVDELQRTVKSQEEDLDLQIKRADKAEGEAKDANALVNAMAAKREKERKEVDEIKRQLQQQVDDAVNEALKEANKVAESQHNLTKEKLAAVEKERDKLQEENDILVRNTEAGQDSRRGSLAPSIYGKPSTLANEFGQVRYDPDKSPSDDEDSGSRRQSMASSMVSPTRGNQTIELANARNKIKSLEEQLQKLKDEKDDAGKQAEAIKEKDEELARQKARVEQLEAQVKKLDEEIKAAKKASKKLQEKEKELKEQQAALEKAKKEVASLQTQLDELKKENDDEAKGKKAKKGEVQKLRAEKTQLEKQVKDLEAQLKNDAASKDKALKNCEDEKATHKTDIEKLQKQVSKLEQQLKDAGSSKGEKEDKLEKLREEKEKVEEEIRNLKAKLADMENQVKDKAEKEKALKDCEDQRATRETEIADLKKQLAALQKKLADSAGGGDTNNDEELKELEKKIEELEDENRSLEITVTDLQDEIKNPAKDPCEEVRKELEKARKELEELEKVRKELEKTKEELEDAKLQLENTEVNKEFFGDVKKDDLQRLVDRLLTTELKDLLNKYSGPGPEMAIKKMIDDHAEYRYATGVALEDTIARRDRYSCMRDVDARHIYKPRVPRLQKYIEELQVQSEKLDALQKRYKATRQGMPPHTDPLGQLEHELIQLGLSQEIERLLREISTRRVEDREDETQVFKEVLAIFDGTAKKDDDEKKSDDDEEKDDDGAKKIGGDTKENNKKDDKKKDDKKKDDKKKDDKKKDDKKDDRKDGKKDDKEDDKKKDDKKDGKKKDNDSTEKKDDGSKKDDEGDKDARLKATYERLDRIAEALAQLRGLGADEYMGDLLSGLTEISATARQGIVAQMDSQIAWHEQERERRNKQITDGDGDGKVAADPDGLVPLTRRQYDAIRDENRRLTDVIEELRVQRQWTQDVIQFSEDMRARGEPIAGPLSKVTGDGGDDDKEKKDKKKDKGKKRDDGNKKEEKGKGGNTGRGVEVAFGGDNWGFRQVLRVDTRRCCGGCGGLLCTLFMILAFVFMVAVTIAEGRQYSAWRNSNNSSRALYRSADEHFLCFRPPDFDLFWEFILLLINGRFTW